METFNVYKQKPIAERKIIYNKLKSQFPTKIFVIISLNNIPINTTNKITNKFIVDYETTVDKLIFNIRKELIINENQAIFTYVNNNINVRMNSKIGNLYDIYKDKDDGFLYIMLCSENTFG